MCKRKVPIIRFKIHTTWERKVRIPDFTKIGIKIGKVLTYEQLGNPKKHFWHI